VFDFSTGMSVFLDMRGEHAVCLVSKATVWTAIQLKRLFVLFLGLNLANIAEIHFSAGMYNVFLLLINILFYLLAM